MFGLGMMEIGLIIAIAVMLFPPTELPKLARSIARIYGQVRKTAEDFRSAVLDDEDLREPINEIKGAYNEARFEVRDAERKARQQLAKAQMELRMATARRIQAEKEAEGAAGAADAAAGGAKDGAGAGAGAGPGAGDAGAGAADGATEGATGADGGAASSASNAVGAGSEPEADGGDPRGPVAGTDPRVIAARRSGAYTPRVAAAEPEPEAESPGTDEPREGVA